MEQQQISKQVWMQWTLATTVGYALGTLLILPWMVNLAYAAQPEWLMGLAGGAGWGLAVGVAQWLVLRRYAQQPSIWWTVATVAGAMLGLALGLALADAIPLPTLSVARRGASTFMLMLPAALKASIIGP